MPDNAGQEVRSIDKQEAYRIYRGASALYRAGRYREALASIEIILEAYPAHAQLILAREMCLKSLQETDAGLAPKSEEKQPVVVRQRWAAWPLAVALLTTLLLPSVAVNIALWTSRPSTSEPSVESPTVARPATAPGQKAAVPLPAVEPAATSTPATEPAVALQSEATPPPPAVTPVPVTKPAPAAQLEPTPTPRPAVTPAPATEPAPVVQPEPTPTPPPAVTPAPATEPAPVAQPEPTSPPPPVVTPAPATKPVPATKPETLPDSVPMPLPPIDLAPALGIHADIASLFPERLREAHDKILGSCDDLRLQPLVAYVCYNAAYAVLDRNHAVATGDALVCLNSTKALLEGHHCRNTVLYLKTLEALVTILAETDPSTVEMYRHDIEKRRALLCLDAQGRSVARGFTTKRFVERVDSFLLPVSSGEAMIQMHNDLGLTEEEETAVQATATPSKYYFNLKSHPPEVQARTLETRLIDTNVMLLDMFTPGCVTAKELTQTVKDTAQRERHFSVPSTVFTPYLKLNSERANFVLKPEYASMTPDWVDAQGAREVQTVLDRIRLRKRNIQALCRLIPSEMLTRDGQGVLFIDIGPGVANYDVSAVSSMEIAADFPRMRVAALDLPDQVAKMSKISARAKEKLQQFSHLVIVAGDGLDSLKTMIETHNRNGNQPIDIDATRMVIVRAANSIDIYCPWAGDGEKDCRRAIKTMALDFEDKPLLLFFNRSILFKPQGQPRYQLWGRLSSSGFAHNSNGLTRGQQEPYELLPY